MNTSKNKKSRKSQKKTRKISSFKYHFIVSIVWVISRVLFVTCVLAITWLIKLPIENLIEINNLRDLNKMQKEKVIKTINEIIEMQKYATDAYRSYIKMSDFVAKYRHDSEVILPSIISRNAAENLDRFKTQFYNREFKWHKKYEECVNEVLSNIEDGTDYIESILYSKKVTFITNDIKNKIFIKNSIVESSYESLQSYFDEALNNND